MTFFADLTPYAYRNTTGPGARLLHVGWLDPSHPFPTAEPDASLVERLGELCASATCARSRGFFRCRLPRCRGGRQELGLIVTIDGRDVRLGSAELWIPFEAGTWFAAPDLIYHYVRDHEYQPPQEFLRAVFSEGAGSFGEDAWREWIQDGSPEAGP